MTTVSFQIIFCRETGQFFFIRNNNIKFSRAEEIENDEIVCSLVFFGSDLAY